MKKMTMIKALILISIVLVFSVSSLIIFILNYYKESSKVSRKISIHGYSEWEDAKTAGICTGSGTYSDPYVIEDLKIDGGGKGSCISITGSDVYFIIENCTLYNSGSEIYDSGIKLSRVSNGRLINNNANVNIRYGISLSYKSENNTISGNILNDNEYGISLNDFSNNNTISGNKIDNNKHGIYFLNSYNNIFSGNLMNNCGIYPRGVSPSYHGGNQIDITNLVNGKPVYYYSNENNLGPSNFTNAGQIILVSCSGCLISKINISNSSWGITLNSCFDNIISENIIQNNYIGIYLYDCNNNTISRNVANNNDVAGIYLWGGSSNTISGNDASNNTNDGILLFGSDYNTIMDNLVDNNDRAGICLSGVQSRGNIYGCEGNTVLGNIANDNRYGIYLKSSNNNVISGNTLIGNWKCISEVDCQGNEFNDNGACTYEGQDDDNDENGGIPLQLIILISIIIGGVAICTVVTVLLIGRKKKSRIQNLLE